MLQKMFNIYPGETKNALLFAVLGFLWAFGVTCGLKFADALFLLHVGADSLPQLYTLTSCGMIAIASFLLYAFHHFSSYRIFLSVLLLGICFYIFIFICLTLDIGLGTQWFWFALRIAGSFLFSVLMTCYWTFIDQYHHLRDAKRLYSLFSCTIFLGVAGTGAVMHSGLLTLDNLIVLIVFVLGLTFYWVRKIAHDIPLVMHEDNELEGGGTEENNSLKFLFKSILSSRFTLLLMLCNFSIQLLLVITEYNYMSTFQHYFSSQPINLTDEGTESNLTLFLGQWLATVSVTNLIFGLFIYSRFIRRFGVTSLLAVTPILLIISFSGWSMSNSMLFPLIGFFVVEGTLSVIDDSNFNLLLNAVPSKLKYKIRVIIESFFEPVGMLISATLLHFFQRESKTLGLILATATLLIALALRSQYLRALFSNLAENTIHFQRSLEEWLNWLPKKEQQSTAHRLLAILKIKDEKAQLFACEGLLAFEDETILKQLLRQISSMPPLTKIKILPLFEQSIFSKETIVLDAIQSWTEKDFSHELMGATQYYLAKQGLLHPEKAILHLKSSDIKLQGAAIIALKYSYADLPAQTVANNRSLAAEHLKLLLDSDKQENICLGLSLLGIEGETQDVDILISYLSHPLSIVAKTAAQSILQIDTIDTTRQAPAILEHLNRTSEPEIRIACLKALGKTDDSRLVSSIIESSIHFRANERRLIESIVYKMGLKTVPTLIVLTKNIYLHDRSRMLAGRILGRLSLPQLRANLSTIIQHEIDRAYFYFYHSHTIQSSYPQYELSQLTNVLETGYQSVIDFIIQLLAAAGEVEDTELLSRSLKSRNPKLRSQVVETLEKTCEPSIFRLLQPLVEDLPQNEKISAYVKTGHRPLSLSELLDKMSESATQIDGIIAATLKYHLNLPNWRESLRQQMLQQDEIFHHFAYELLEEEK